MKRHERLPLLLAACLSVSAAACNVATSTDEAASAADEISDVVATDLGEVRGASSEVDGTVVRIFTCRRARFVTRTSRRTSIWR